jgi:hypothetical protein
VIYLPDFIVRLESSGYACDVNFRPILLPLVSFATGAGVLALYRAGFGEPGARSGPGGSASAAYQEGRVPGGLKSIPSAGHSDVSPEVLALAGLSGRPTLDDVFEATGIDRPLRIAIFLQSATSDEIAGLMARAKKEWTYDISLTDQIWLRWVEVDRAAAFKADANGTAVWWAWAKQAPRDALAAAVAATADPRRLEEVIRSIGQGDQDAAIQLLSEYPAADTSLVWEGILTGTGKTDRGTAAALALEKGIKVDEHVGYWAAREPDAALAWARSLEDPAQRRRAMDAVVKELITANPRAALDELGALPAGRSRTDRTAEALAALSRTDPAAARSAAGALPNPADRQRALSALTETLAVRDPAAALVILKDLSWAGPAGWSYQSPNGNSSGSLSGGTDHNSIRQLMQSAPEATINTLVSLPSERKAPVRQAVQQWAAHQPEAASRWIQGMPASTTKDTAISGLTQWLTHESPEPDYEAALAWGAAASTLEQQFNEMQNTISAWRNQDWKAARAAVDRLPITPEQREQILQNLGNSPQNP